MPSSTASSGPPFVGALLRLGLGRVRARMHQALHNAGFTDIQDHHMAVLSYPPPDGTRPADLARRAGMSRQALNHLLAQVEELGYLERRAAGDSDRRLVFTTPRGWQAVETIWACLKEVHAELALEVGEERFAQFMAVLRRVALDDLRAFAPRHAQGTPAAGQSRPARLSSRTSRPTSGKD